MADSVEKLIEVALKAQVVAGLATDPALSATLRCELIDDAPAEDLEDKEAPAIITKPGIGVPVGYLQSQHQVPVTITIQVHQAADPKKAALLLLFERVMDVLKTTTQTTWRAAFSSGTFQAVNIVGGNFRTEENMHLAEIETDWTVCI